ncbi:MULTISPECIES: hypothetical protein [unclassified Haloferax]|nr:MULTISPECIES: hypothetical protein [unclassified Haloferax]RDZ33920.1 hypothetical protein C5B88_14675 [Haloferax sp. Atlit-24N]RLM33525.1 hypothetical protein DVK03_17740 [Haloferax sp. Atlit-109R]RLM40897.1 hypothetical protein DVK04_18580 [Haloferax sp. Atlit-105R]
MEINITFRDGPIDVEITATEEESYTDVLEELGQFVEKYDPIGYQTQKRPDQENPSEETEETLHEGGEQGSISEFTETDDENSYFEVVDATDSELLRVLTLGSTDGDDIDEFPQIIGDVQVLGDSNQDRLLNGSSVLLTVLSEVHGVSRASTSELKNALDESGIDIGNWANVGRPANADVYLNRRGSGSSATTEIREPGKEDAYEQIQALVDNLQSQEPAAEK